MGVELVNLTPHTINVQGVSGEVREISPSGVVARVSESSEVVGEVEGIALYASVYGEVVDLPEPKEGLLFVVSALVKSAVPNRADVVSPGALVRNAEGQPVGCRACGCGETNGEKGPASERKRAFFAFERMRACVCVHVHLFIC